MRKNSSPTVCGQPRRGLGGTGQENATLTEPTLSQENCLPHIVPTLAPHCVRCSAGVFFREAQVKTRLRSVPPPAPVLLPGCIIPVGFRDAVLAGMN
jgi:hypothetical protein